MTTPIHPFLADLTARDLIADATGVAELSAHLAEAPRTFYVGFDPTADSLHVGSLLPLLALRRVQLAGHRPIVLVGGATGLIGDPSGKVGERSLNPAEVVHAWADRLKAQVSRFVDFEGGTRAAILADNYAWLSQLSVIPFLRDVGKHFAVGAMLAKESVRARLGRADAGISYTEFSYQILQAYDFLSLWRLYGCTVQMGGSDQWGNITAGIDLIRRIEATAAFGITLPLVIKADGAKFGKTESGTIWLDPAKTSPYEMYQFWLNTADADVVRFLKYFTFLALEDIEGLRRRTGTAPEAREAQRVLAREVTRLVHGDDAVADAEAITQSLFTGDVAALSPSQLQQAFAGAPTTALSAADFETPLVDVLVRIGVAESKRRSRELLDAGAVYINGRRAENSDATLSRDAILSGGFVVFRRGKKSFHIARLEGR